ncbi:MAG: hypothetical protein IJ548_08485 [Paludibacteraceae bacterium]|nr:hypothetical protein [Prevotella sp.]MBQ8706319.1 hypothetical protein [Paludibacteraceae bacterium]MBQ8715547.1 hypothetical protein [Prevotella sp.]
MKRITFASLSLLSICLTSCDDGLIYNEVAYNTVGRSAKLEGKITGLGNWAEGYTIAVAGFTGDDDYASISKAVQTDSEGNATVIMTNIPDEVTSVQLCVLDRLRRHVMTFYEADIEGVRDTIRMEVGTVDASMFNAIQQSYLTTTCANCHGASNRIAAGLNLTEGNAYQAMVGVDSKKVDGKKIVDPNDAENSVLHMVLNQESVEGIGMNHFDLVSEKNAQSILPLIDSWINNGAIEK